MIAVGHISHVLLIFGSPHFLANVMFILILYLTEIPDRERFMQDLVTSETSWG